MSKRILKIVDIFFFMFNWFVIVYYCVSGLFNINITNRGLALLIANATLLIIKYLEIANEKNRQ